VRFNIETTSGGGTAPNEHYIKKFKVPAGKEDSIYLRNLSKIETLGCFFNNLGNSYSEIGDMESALRALETAVEINPSLAESRMNLGNIYLKKGWVKDAIDEYRRALRINPNDAKTGETGAGSGAGRHQLVLPVRRCLSPDGQPRKSKIPIYKSPEDES
jgi:tetratricopeptide (TPR) repeat protein